MITDPIKTIHLCLSSFKCWKIDERMESVIYNIFSSYCKEARTLIRA